MQGLRPRHGVVVPGTPVARQPPDGQLTQLASASSERTSTRFASALGEFSRDAAVVSACNDGKPTRGLVRGTRE
jgi:hypothetical protein